MNNDWSIYVLIFAIASIVLARMDRLGKQLEAVCASIRADLARTEDGRDAVMREWQQSKKDQAKDARQFWIFWRAIGVATLVWNMVAKHGS